MQNINLAFIFLFVIIRVLQIMAGTVFNKRKAIFRYSFDSDRNEFERLGRNR